MSKDSLDLVQEGNLPDQWDPTEATETPNPPEKKRSFRKWDRGSFSNSSQPEVPASPLAETPPVALQSEQHAPDSVETPVPSNLLGEQHKQPPLPPAEPPPPPVAEGPSLAENQQVVNESVLALINRLPPRHAPPLQEFQQKLDQGLVPVNAAGEVSLSGLQDYFVTTMGWSEHKFSSFTRPLISNLSAFGLKTLQSSASSNSLAASNTSTNLPKFDPSASAPDYTSSTNLAQVSDGSGIVSAGSSSSLIQPTLTQSSSEIPISHRSSSTNNLPAFQQPPAPEPVPLPPGAVESVTAFLLECATHSMLKTLLDEDALTEYLHSSLADVWENGEFNLQELWTNLNEIPHVSEPLVLSVFNEISKHESEWPHPLRLPKEVRKDLNKKVAAAPLAFRAPSQTHQPEPEKPKTKKKDEFSRGTNPQLIVLGAVIVLGALAYYFLMMGGESMRGDVRDPGKYAEILPLDKIRYNKANQTFYAIVTKSFMKWDPNRRVRAIFRLKKFVIKKDGARIIRLIKPNGELYARLGRGR